MDFEQIQARQDAFKLKVMFKENIVPTSLEECIYYTLYASKETKYENGRKQCRKGAYRSAEDAYRIAKTYFPDVTYREIYALARRADKMCLLRCGYCPDVRKIVYSPYDIVPKTKFINTLK